MTPQPEKQVPEVPEAPEGGINLDINAYVRALERKNAQLLRENTVLDAVIEQISQEKVSLTEALEAAMKDRPKHNGRVTTPKPRKTTGKKISHA
jgi:hypothetical protein